jgi:hypothetical protein
MDIYTILASKPHNLHYLNRYVKLINTWKESNRDYIGYTEKHHICPRAKDMFPEYQSFKDHPWNKVNLTPRQHFIAHMLLWKIYSNRSMTRTFGIMRKNGCKNSKIYESIKLDYQILISKQMSGTITVMSEDGTCKRVKRSYFDQNKEVFGYTKGMTYALDSFGNGHYVKKGDYRFKTGELKGNNAGTITITDGNINKRVSPHDNIPKGWYRGMSKKSPKGTTWINNGIVSKMINHSEIPDGYVVGRLFKTKPKHVGTKGKIWINNGKTNKMIDRESEIPLGWTRGRLSLS